MHECKMHEKNCFITLTYNDTHLPQDRSLDKVHWQKFVKRARKWINKTKAPDDRTFRYYHCGEYGDETARPHYHAIVFGQDFMDDRKYLTTTKQGHRLDTSDDLDRLWGLGYCQVGEASFDSAGYVARYVMKKQNGERADAHYEIEIEGQKFMRLPEYSSMSLKPGIGKTWIDKFMSDVYPSDEVITNGHPATPPRFYDDQHAKANAKGARIVKINRQVAGQKHEDNNTYTRLQVREEVTKARTRTLTRHLK